MKKLFCIFWRLVLLTAFALASTVASAQQAAQTNNAPNADLEQRMQLLKQLIAQQAQQDQSQVGQPQTAINTAANAQPLAISATPQTQAQTPVAPQALPSLEAPAIPPAPQVSQPIPTSLRAPIAGGDVYEDAFSGVVNQMLPMSPEQISRLRMLFNETQRAAVTPVGVPPKPVTTSVAINLSPQAIPPVIRLGAGYITSLVFLDSTGQPWPIEAYSIGDPTAFNLQWDKKSNTLLIQSVSYYKRSNLAVILKNLNTPIMLTLISGQEAVDYRVDLRVPGFGPNAMFIQGGIPDSANPILLDVLNGIPPKGSKQLKVTGGDCDAWLLNNRLYLRTTLDVISPAWKSVMSSVDGTHAYELQPAPVILALQHGKDKTLILTIEGFE